MVIDKFVGIAAELFLCFMQLYLMCYNISERRMAFAALNAFAGCLFLFLAFLIAVG